MESGYGQIEFKLINDPRTFSPTKYAVEIITTVIADSVKLFSKAEGAFVSLLYFIIFSIVVIPF